MLKYIYIYIYISIYTHTHTFTHVYTYTIPVYIYIYIYTHMAIRNISTILPSFNTQDISQYNQFPSIIISSVSILK